MTVDGAGEPDRHRGPTGGADDTEAGLVPAPPGDDGGWQWDGDRWQYAEDLLATDAPAAVVAAPVRAGPQWVWDGSTWQPAS